MDYSKRVSAYGTGGPANRVFEYAVKHKKEGIPAKIISNRRYHYFATYNRETDAKSVSEVAHNNGYNSRVLEKGGYYEVWIHKMVK
jgi:hypothetical protein